MVLTLVGEREGQSSAGVAGRGLLVEKGGGVPKANVPGQYQRC